MRISDIKECLERMSTIYPFKDEETNMRFEPDIRTGRDSYVTISTTDEETNVDIQLSTKPKKDERKPWEN